MKIGLVRYTGGATVIEIVYPLVLLEPGKESDPSILSLSRNVAIRAREGDLSLSGCWTVSI